MRITQISLNDYLLFKDSGITNLHIDYTEDVQIILGSNGSGKTQLMRQLSPYPASRSLFGKTGHKAITFQVADGAYRLESDYQKPSSPHLFIDLETEQNLNIGRTSEEQKDLILAKLGLTPLVDSLIMGSLDFPKMLPSKRRDFLMANNPDDIGFVHQLARQTASKIKACKNTLSHLQSRKIILEQDLLSPEAIAELEAEKDTIGIELGNFQKLLMEIEVASRTVPTVTAMPDFDMRDIKRRLAKIRYALSDLRHVSRDDKTRETQKLHFVGELASCETRIGEDTRTIEEQSLELHELEVRYKELAPDLDLHDAEENVARLEKERDFTRIEQPTFELSPDGLEEGYRFLGDLQTHLQIFERCDIPLYSRIKRRRREQVLGQMQYKQSSYRTQIGDLETQLTDLSKRHSMSPSDIPTELCSKDKCPLYAHFMEGYQTTESKRTAIRSKLQYLKKRLVRIDVYVQAASDYFSKSQYYHDKIAWLIEQSQRNPILHKVLTKTDVLTVLATSPNRIAMRVRDEYDHIQQWMRYKAVLSDLETAYSLRKRFLGSQDADTIKLVVSIDNLKKSLESLRLALDAAIARKKILEDNLRSIEQYEHLKRTAFGIRDMYTERTQLLHNGFEHKVLRRLKDKVEDLRSQSFLRMSEVERTLRKQSGIQERYQEEAISQIKRIETDLGELQRIEKCLIAIPRDNIIAFVNGIFKQANLFIKAIWTVPFQIELLTEDDPLDYTFKVSGDNQSVREMSECSAGQSELLAFVLNLALRVQLKHLNLPMCLDEPARTFDDEHRRKFITLLRHILDERIVSQLFIISHDVSMHEGLKHTETFVIRGDNFVLPPIYNQHATMR